MQYSAKAHYRDQAVVDQYDRKRFTGLRGRIVEKRELAVVQTCISHLAPGDTILDIPVGTGRFAKLFVSKGLKTYCGDISDAMLRYTEKVIGPSDHLVELKHADAENKQQSHNRHT